MSLVELSSQFGKIQQTSKYIHSVSLMIQTNVLLYVTKTFANSDM